MKQSLHTILFLIIVSIWTIQVNAKPIVPGDDNQVLEILPVKMISSVEREALRKAHKAWQSDPKNIYAVNALARLYIAQSRQLADPRYLGYAEALLEPWVKMPKIPTAIRILRATILQRNHQFDAALAEIKNILGDDPTEPEALLMQATILQVRADYEGARKSCKRLYSFSTLIIGMACTAQIDGLTGHAVSAFEQISTLLNLKNAGLTAEVRNWMRLIHIDLAQRLGREDEVARGFKTLLSEHASLPSEARIQYADWLILNGRFQDVVDIGVHALHDDGTLLRLVIAEEALRLPEAAIHRTLLHDRFAAAKLRGDSIHQREESRFRLEVMHQPKEALVLAQANWAIQREPADARVLLAAALKSGQPSAAQPILQWLKDSHIEDADLIQQSHAVLQ